MDKKQLILSSFVKKMEKEGFFEVARWPIHIPDEQIIREIERDERFSHYASFGGGVSLFTHAGVKAFFCYIPKRSKKERESIYNRKLSHQNQAYNNIEPIEEHPLNQMDSDQSFQVSPSG